MIIRLFFAILSGGENMVETAVTTNPKKNRRDHYLPQSYLRGFIDPERMNCQQPLWHLGVSSGVWTERSPREIGYRQGFYDYVTAEVGVETAENAFAELERKYPRIRRELISKNFKNWKDHRDFLLRYIQMMRARSLLFFDQKNTEGRNLRAWVVEEVNPDRKSVKVRSMTPEPLAPQFIRNWTITQMREEIQKGAAWLNGFNWALRYCESPADPFVISEIPVMAYGPSATLEEALRNPDTLLFFPLCWQACLIGSRQFFHDETGVFLLEDMRRARKMYREKSDLFILSPRKLDF
jgi:hypothetical protein